MADTSRTLVVVATYNEIENLPRLVDGVFEYCPDVNVLVIDDNSPDGTGEWCDQRCEGDARVACLHRAGKLGLGSATVAGFRYALEHEYEFVLTMDADFSHHPRYLPDLRGPIEVADSQVDVMVGSRYVPGGGIEGWPLHRLIMSRGINTYSRMLLGLSVNDCSGAFRCYRTSILKQIDLDEVRSCGYSYVEEILWLLDRQGARFGEAPIIFVDRELGQTKINWQEAVTAVFLILRFGIQRLLWG
ncbi:MAG: glycosyl transferase [Planctomycetaceae bacterium]|nr:glycosyl transferase [Planctomycetaceae bacterium]